MEGRSTDTTEWRLKARGRAAGDTFHAVTRLLRGGGEKILGATVGGTLSPDAVLTHKGDTMFVYTTTHGQIVTARSAVEAALRTVGQAAELSISNWDEDLADWHQVDPPLAGDALELHEARMRDATRHTTRFLACTAVGRKERLLLASLADGAQQAGVECTVREEPRRLRTRLTFTISGPASKADRFFTFLRTEIGRLDVPPTSAGP